MPQTGTTAALKGLFSGKNIIVADLVLTPADIGRTIICTGGVLDVSVPVIPGVPPSATGVNDGTVGIGSGGTILIIAGNGGAGSTVTFPAPARPIVSGGSAVRDTYNGGLTTAVVLTTVGDWILLTSDGGVTNPSDWTAMEGVT